MCLRFNGVIVFNVTCFCNRAPPQQTQPKERNVISILFNASQNHYIVLQRLYEIYEISVQFDTSQSSCRLLVCFSSWNQTRPSISPLIYLLLRFLWWLFAQLNMTNIYIEDNGNLQAYDLTRPSSNSTSRPTEMFQHSYLHQ